MHLSVLWAFAIAQPLFGVLADSPEFFVARDNTAGDIVVLALAVTFVPPLLLIAVEAAFARAASARRAIHLVFVATLVGAFVLQLLERVSGSAAVVIPIALLAGAGGALAYARVPPVRTVVTVLAPAPLAFLALFLLASPVAKLVLPQDAAAAGREAAGTQTPVVMVIFDEFAATALIDGRGRLNAARHPSFAELAASATWYPNATSVADFTPRAVPAILTGRLPDPGEVPIASEQPDSLFTLLGPSHRMNVEEPVTALCPESLCARRRDSTRRRLRALAEDLGVVLLRRLAPRDLEDGLPAVDQGFAGFGDRTEAVRKAAGGQVAFDTLQNRPGTFTRFLRRIRPVGGRPALDFLHIAAPHLPWEFLPSGQQYPVSGDEVPGLAADSWLRRADLVRQAEQRYLLQVGYVDRLLGQLIRRLRSVGLWDRALVVVTADHGVSFQPGRSRRRFTRETAADIASVPLFVKAPGQRAAKVDRSRIRTVDVLPTMARVLGIELGWRTEPPTGDVRMNDTAIGHQELDLRRVAAADRQSRLFGTTPEDLLSWSVRPLRGQPVPGSTRVQLDGDFADVDPAGPVVPAFVTGRLSDDGFGRVQVVVNGRPGPVVPTFRAGDETRFAAVVAPARLRRGRNDVRVLGVDGTRLVALEQEARQTFRLEGDAIVGTGGRRVRITRGAVGGYVDALGVEQGRLRVSGWAATRRGPAERVVVFAGDRFVGSVAPGAPRPDVAEDLGPRALASGWQLATASADARADVRVFALSGDVATPLQVAPG